MTVKIVTDEEDGPPMSGDSKMCRKKLHPMTPQNTRVVEYKGKVSRRCRECLRKYDRELKRRTYGRESFLRWG